MHRHKCKIRWKSTNAELARGDDKWVLPTFTRKLKIIYHFEKKKLIGKLFEILISYKIFHVRKYFLIFITFYYCKFKLHAAIIHFYFIPTTNICFVLLTQICYIFMIFFITSKMKIKQCQCQKYLILYLTRLLI